MPNAPQYQIVILDEADNMTIEAQSALRRIIEDHTETTRFCLICNYITRIIDPIVSRCAKFRFGPLTVDSQIKRLQYISARENVNVNEAVLRQIIDVSEGDLRRSINLLQSMSQIDSSFLNEDLVNDICGVIPKEFIKETIDKARSTDTADIRELSDEIEAQGFDSMQLISQVQEYVLESEFDDREKNEIGQAILLSYNNLLKKGTPKVELMNLLGTIRKTFMMQE